MNKIISILLVSVLCLTFGGCTNLKNEKTYDEACEAVSDENIELAKQLFEEIPENYEPPNNNATPKEWLESIEKYYNSDFIGTWTNGSYKIEISREASKVNGVYLRYSKRYTSPGGVSVSDHGWIRISDEGDIATYYNSSASNAKNYELKLVDDDTIEVWFDGLKGYNREITLSRVGSR